MMPRTKAKTTLSDAITEIEEQGYKVRTTHFRRWTTPEMLATHYGAALSGPPALQLEPKGGRTQVDIVNKDGEIIVRSTTVVAVRDTYCKRTGRLKAVMRAAHALRRVQAGAAIAIEVTPYNSELYSSPIGRVRSIR